jgi:glutamate--cysteine ligase
MLLRGEEEVALRDWGASLLEAMLPVAELLDAAHQSEDYRDVLAHMSDRLADDRTTPAATLLQEMADNQETYYSMAMRKACEHRQHFIERPLTDDTIAKYRQLASNSLQLQAEIEASDSLSFEEFLNAY